MIENKLHQPSFFDKLKKGFVVALKSLKFIWQHKKLLFFPLLTASLIVASIGVYEVAYFRLYQQHITSFFPEGRKSKKRNRIQEEQPKSEQLQQERSKNKYSLEFLLFVYVITFACIFFFAFSNVALSYASSQAFVGAPIKLGASLIHSVKQFPTLLVWSFAALIIHILVNIFKGKNNNESSSFLGRLVGEAIEFAWYIATFLVIPVMAHENIGAFKSIKRSAHLMKKTFGENLAAALLLPQLLGIVLFVWALLAFGILQGVIYIGKMTEMRVTFAIILPLIGFFVVVAGIICAIVSAATTVFKTAAYHYAIGNPVGPFSEKEVQSSFVTEVKK